MTAIGFVIQPGESIPEDVVGVDDADDRPWVYTGRGHWHTSKDAIDSCRKAECYEDSTWKMWRRFPLTVTAVREQPAEPEPPRSQTVRVQMALNFEQRDDKVVFSTHEGEIGSCDSGTFLASIAEEFDVTITPNAAAEPEPDDPIHYYFTELRTGLTSCGINALDEDEDVMTTSEAGKATCEACRVAVDEEPVAESVSVDVRDLARQHGNQRYLQGAAAPLDSRDHGQRAEALFARIEAEVQRLRTERDRPGYMEQNRMLIAEVERLRRLLKTQAENFSAATDKLVAERDDYATLMKLTAVERDAARAEVERLKAELAAEEEGRREDWVDRLTPPDPLVLTLPQVPAGATLRGLDTGKLYSWDEPGCGWRRGRWIGTLGELLSLQEPTGVTVEMAPPREARTWPKLDPEPEREFELPTVVLVEGIEGTWKRVGDGDCFVRPDFAPRTLLGLRTLGEVREVFDEDGADR